MESLTTAQFFDLDSFSYSSLFEGIEYPWEALTKLSTFLQNQKLGTILGDVSPAATLVNPEAIFIDEGAVVEAGAYVVGPCILGKKSLVRHGAYLRGNVLLGEGAILGHTTEAKNTILLNGAKASHFAYLGDSILGNRVNLGAGVKCANVRFDKKNVHIYWNNKLIDTGLKKFGAIFGDDVQLGCNAVTNPGTLVGPGSFWAPCLNAGGVIPSRSRIKHRTEPEVVLS